MAQIIKANTTISSSGQEVRPQAFNFDDMSSQAQGYLDSVQKQAAQILQKAQADAEQIRKQAAKEGEQQAVDVVEAKMRDQVRQQMQTVLPAMKEAVDEIRNSRHAWRKHWEDRAIHLAVLIAERILQREVEWRPEVTRELIQEALELAAGESGVTLRLHPRDHQTLKDQLEPLLAALSGLGEVQVLTDASVQPGGCKVTTRYGEIDQQLRTKLETMERELTT